MRQEEKIEKAKSYLQSRINQDFPYPFRVTYEQNHFLFRLCSGKKECCARLQQSREIVDRISDGTREEREAEVARLFEILRAAIQAQESTALSRESSYEKVKNSLILRPLNYQHVKRSLKNVPFTRIGDIALVLYAVMAHKGGDYFTAKMHRTQMQNWDREEKDVLEEALVNTSFLYPPRLYSVEDLLSWDQKRHEDGRFMTADGRISVRKGMRGYILTNTLEINGSIALFYPGVARQIAEGFGEDFYVAFTSIHEAQIHAASMISPDVIRSSLRDTNRHCNRFEEVLTNRVYCYRYDSDRFGIIQDGEFLEVERNV